MMNILFHVIKDPVHGTMQFTSTEDAWIKPFIDSPIFQRLRHIKQLGLGDLIFPGAVHSRFNHCIGACYVASQIAHKIGLPDDERQLVMIAALLHDIGHGPFSHAFEDLFREKAIRHEEWTPYFLQDFDQQFFAAYNKKNPQHPLDEAKFRTIVDMIMHKPGPKQVLADIVSSQLDADRLDYLRRDSHFCGVSYGEFDFRWMLHCLTIIPCDSGERLGITHKGIGVVEHYLMARRLMMRNIYHAHKKLAIEAYLVQLLVKLAQDLAKYPLPSLRQNWLGQFLNGCSELNEDAIGEQRKNQFLSHYYHHYKNFADYDIFALIKQLSILEIDLPAIQLAKRLQYRVMPKIVRLDNLNYQALEAARQTFLVREKDYQDWQLMLTQTPHRAYTVREDPILVMNELKEIHPIEDYSFTIQSLSDRFEKTIFLAVDKVVAEDAKIIAFIKSLRETELIAQKEL